MHCDLAPCPLRETVFPTVRNSVSICSTDFLLLCLFEYLYHWLFSYFLSSIINMLMTISNKAEQKHIHRVTPKPSSAPLCLHVHLILLICCRRIFPRDNIYLHFFALLCNGTQGNPAHFSFNLLGRNCRRLFWIEPLFWAPQTRLKVRVWLLMPRFTNCLSDLLSSPQPSFNSPISQASFNWHDNEVPSALVLQKER